MKCLALQIYVLNGDLMKVDTSNYKVLKARPS
jgi:hypothetical protein